MTEDHIEKIVGYFRQLTRNYALFHIAFFLLTLIELLALLLFFPFFAKSSLLAFALAILFLTGFSYFVLRFYLEAKKPEQLFQLQQNFLRACTRDMPSDLSGSELHLSRIEAVYSLIKRLEGQEYRYYLFAHRFETLTPLLEKFSFWWHWSDVHQMKEMLHLYSIQECISLVKGKPTDLEVHTSLANAYIALYKLYKEGAFPADERVQKFQKTAERAIEELKILDTYAPNEPWVHAQLASIYHDLELPEQEIEEYETLLRIVSQDNEILFRLGVLYFQQGRNAQGLKIYEQLKKAEEPKSEELILFYDAYRT